MSLSLAESIFFVGLSVGLVVAVMVAFAMVRRRARRRFAGLCTELELLPASPAESTVDGSRRVRMGPRLERWLGFLVPPSYFAHGTRDGFRVELRLCEGGDDSDDTTSVAVIGGDALPKELTIWPQQGWLDRVMVPGLVRMRLIGPSTCEVSGGTPADVRGLISPATEVALAAFPREIRQLVFRGPAFMLAWQQLEKDPGVIEHALRLAVLCWRAARQAPKSHE